MHIKEYICKNVHAIYAVIFLLFFISILLVPISRINHADKSILEKRNLAKWPILIVNSKLNEKYGTHFENWLSDRFRGRYKIISAYNKVNNLLLGRLENSKAMLGNEGFFFYKGENSIANYQNKNIFDEKELETIRDNILLRRKLLEKRGIKYYVMIAPDKNRVYGEKYPDYILKYHAMSRAEQLVSYLKKYGIDVVYPLHELNSGKQTGITYFRYDTHWNTFGAFIGYDSIMKMITNDIPTLRKLSIEDFDIVNMVEESGDLLPMLNLTIKDIDNINHSNLKLQKKVKYNYEYITNKGRNGVKTNNNNPLNHLNLCMLRDSFTSSMEPYFSESFSHSVYIWNQNFNANYEKILQANPDIVVQENVERSLPAFITNTPQIGEEITSFSGYKFHNSDTKLKFHVDQKENREFIIRFKGWAFLHPKKTRNQKTYLLVEDKTGNQKVFSTGTTIRKDVGKYFKEDLCSYSGFDVLVDKMDLFQGKNKFKLIVVNDKEISISPAFCEFTL